MKRPFPSLPRKFLLAGCALWAAGSCGAIAADKDKAPLAPEVVELPRFVVEDTRVQTPMESHWQYAALPGYEVLSSMSAKKTVGFLKDFLEQQQVLNLVWPTLNKGVTGRPVTLVLSDKQDCFAEYLPPSDKKDEAALNQILLETVAGTVLVIDFAKTELDSTVDNGLSALASSSTDPSTQSDGLLPGVIEADPYRAAKDGYLRQVIGRGGRMPAWLVEGLVQIITDVDFTKKTVIIGRIGDERGLRPNDFSYILGNTPLIGMEQLFGPRPKDTDENAVVWKAQAYAFVHMCIFGEKLKYREALAGYAARLEREPASEQLFTQYFNEDFKAMKERLRAYCWDGRQKYNEVNSKNGVLFAPVEVPEVREATAAEVGRLRGESLCIAGQAERGIGFMISAYQAGARDRELVAALGMAEARAGRSEKGEKLLAAAVKAKTSRADAYLVYAKLRVRAALASHPGRGLSRSELDEAQGLLRAGSALQPAYSDLFDTTALLWQNTSEQPTRDDLDQMVRMSASFSGRAVTMYHLASLAAAGGFKAEALDYAARGEALTRDPRGQELFRKLRQAHPAVFGRAEAAKSPDSAKVR